VLSAGILCAEVAPAHAFEQGSIVALRLTVDSPSGCADRSTFFTLLQARTAHVREATPEEHALTMHVQMRVSEGQVSSVLTVHEDGGVEGRRELRGTDCDSVVAGLALVAVLIIDPSAALAPSTAPAPSAALAPSSALAASAPAADEVGRAQRSPSVALSASPPASADSSRPRRQTPWLRLSLGTALESASGLGPDPEIIPRLLFDAEFPRLAMGTSVCTSIGRGFMRRVSTSVGTADITPTDARFEPCFDVWSPSTLRVPVCGILELAVLSARGTNTIDAQSGSRASVDLGLALRPTWTIKDRVALGLLLGGGVPLSRYRLYFSPDTTAYRLPAWMAFAEVSVGVRFW